MNLSKPFPLIGFLVLLLFCCALPLRASEEALKITEMAVTTKIAKGNPIDSVRRISSTSVKALYCFTRIVNPEGNETVVKHVWYKDEKPVSEQELKVRGEKWRTWSKRPIDRESVGDWRVDALDSHGTLLKSVKFRIN
jgi:hypothetical protein